MLPSVNIWCYLCWSFLVFSPDNARAYLGGNFGEPTGEFLLKNLMCTGTETSIFDCMTLDSINNNCTRQEAAALSCLEPAPTPPPCKCISLYTSYL